MKTVHKPSINYFSRCQITYGPVEEPQKPFEFCSLHLSHLRPYGLSSAKHFSVFSIFWTSMRLQSVVELRPVAIAVECHCILGAVKNTKDMAPTQTFYILIQKCRDLMTGWRLIQRAQTFWRGGKEDDK